MNYNFLVNTEREFADSRELRQQATLSRLLEISMKLLGHLELDPLLQSIAAGVTEILNGDSGGIYRYDAESGELRPVFPVKQPKEALYTIKAGEGMAGKVIQTGQPMKVDNYDDWHGRTPQQRRGTVGPVMQAPMKSGDQLLGVIYVERSVGRPTFQDEDMESLVLFANYAAIAISNAQIYERSRLAAAELASLYETSLDLTNQLAVSDVLDRIINRAKNLVRGKYGQFYQYEEERKLLVAVFPSNFPGGLTGLMEPGEGLSGRVFTTRKPLMIADYDKWEGRAPNTPTGIFTRTIGIPVEHRDEILGVLTLSRDASEPPFSAADLRLLSLFASQAAIALANAQQYEELQKLYAQVKDKEHLESELRIAHSMQATLLPKKLPRLKGWDMAAMWIPAQIISGDFYDVFAVHGSRLGIVIADVAGKGMPAALFMALCRTLTRTLCIDGRPPQTAITRVNDLILADSSSDWFVTLFYGVLEPKTGTFTYVNAGHNLPLWYRADKKQITPLRAKGIALGVMPSIELEEKVIQMGRGDSLLMYTDGMTEAIDVDGGFFGERRLHASLKALAKKTPKSILDKLQKEVLDFSRGRPASDDLTAVLLKRNASR
jgi:sigma-B regulation protein RsbU (phosphoserine phosphatase)